jgi:hypothetical protein
MDIADIRDLDPGNGVVIHGPRKAVIVTLLQHFSSRIALMGFHRRNKNTGVPYMELKTGTAMMKPRRKSRCNELSIMDNLL